MKIIRYESTGQLFAEMNHKEYEVLYKAILLLSWSAIGAEKDPAKLKLIEEMKDQMQTIKLEY
jgi:hypothetical protein